MAEVTIELDNTAVLASLANTELALFDLSEPFASFGEHLLKRIDDGFRSQVDPYGQPWAPLTQAYLEYKQRKGQITKILQQRGDMRSRTSYQPQPDGLLIGFNDDKAEFHQIRATPTRSLPLRRMMPDGSGLPAQDANELLDILSEHFEEHWQGSGLSQMFD